MHGGPRLPLAWNRTPIRVRVSLRKGGIATAPHRNAHLINGALSLPSLTHSSSSSSPSPRTYSLPLPLLASFHPDPLFVTSPDSRTMQRDVPQASSSHMMKTTKRGRPFLKVLSSPSSYMRPSHSLPLQDTLDLFATLIVSLQLTTHKQFFRSFPNSFTTCVFTYPFLPPTPYLLFFSSQR